ncbi:hypothetical protein EW026_g5625 [Hermanssonia centrifuga]|uniref:proline--tRNA ligase n=1 Tax=Hermanssonia centrifuga TaxID=98765 RepID=A0A4S4KHY2_9APHY|nr:hypothetical protein EW026_g5625 [Hermanssonia centrifuga]
MDPSQGKTYVWQNSWGLSTRTIGVMVMVHGDNQGLVLPPRVASVQVVIIPCGITVKTTDEGRKTINDKCEELASELKKAGVKAKADIRDGYTPGFKFNVPLRLEIGPADIAKQQTLSVRRDTGVKSPPPLADITKSVPALLETIQEDMFKNSRLKEMTNWDDVVPALDNKRAVVLPWWEEEACEDDIVADRLSRKMRGLGRKVALHSV